MVPSLRGAVFLWAVAVGAGCAPDALIAFAPTGGAGRAGAQGTAGQSGGAAGGFLAGASGAPAGGGSGMGGQGGSGASAGAAGGAGNGGSGEVGGQGGTAGQGGAAGEGGAGQGGASAGSGAGGAGAAGGAGTGADAGAAGSGGGPSPPALCPVGEVPHFSLLDGELPDFSEAGCSQGGLMGLEAGAQIQLPDLNLYLKRADGSTFPKGKIRLYVGVATCFFPVPNVVKATADAVAGLAEQKVSLSISPYDKEWGEEDKLFWVSFQAEGAPELSTSGTVTVRRTCDPCSASSDWSPSSMEAQATDAGTSTTVRAEFRDRPGSDPGVEMRICKEGGTFANAVSATFQEWVKNNGAVLFDGTLETAGSTCSAWSPLSETALWSEGEELGGEVRVVSPASCAGAWDFHCQNTAPCGACFFLNTPTMKRSCL